MIQQNASREDQCDNVFPYSGQNSQKNYPIICHSSLAIFLGESDSALIVQQLHYWLQNPNAGYLFRDGCKRILNGYKEWHRQFSWFSERKLAEIFRHLERIGWVISEKFYYLKREVGFIGKPPQMHEDNQRKWYRLDYTKIFEDTGLDLLFNQNKKNGSNPPVEPMYKKCTNQPPKNVQTSIYIESTIYSQEESENLEFIADKEKVAPEFEAAETSGQCQPGSTEHPDQNNLLVQDTISPAAAPPAEIVKCEPLPPSSPTVTVVKFEYPEGDWLDNGRLNDDFVAATALEWRIGDTRNSRAFGAMPIEKVESKVRAHFRKPENHEKLRDEWEAHIAVSKRYLQNVKDRIESGIEIPQDEQGKVIQSVKLVEPLLIEEDIQQLTSDPQPLLKHRGENSGTYKLFEARAEDVDFWRRLSER